jgi:centromere protein O
LAWPLRSYKRVSAAGRRSGSGATAQPVPFRLPYAEDALKTLSLPEGSSYLNHRLSPLC